MTTGGRRLNLEALRAPLACIAGCNAALLLLAGSQSMVTVGQGPEEARRQLAGTPPQSKPRKLVVNKRVGIGERVEHARHCRRPGDWHWQALGFPPGGALARWAPRHRARPTAVPCDVFVQRPGTVDEGVRANQTARAKGRREISRQEPLPQAMEAQWKKGCLVRRHPTCTEPQHLDGLWHWAVTLAALRPGSALSVSGQLPVSLDNGSTGEEHSIRKRSRATVTAAARTQPRAAG
ncbi:hypothetical protein QBC39DRAFT_326601 [Podospora conica]|nr:hypothetical protein QBC39DRAFT_326601 [Schizothecium conicum]